MKTLVVYDELGNIVLQRSGNYDSPVGQISAIEFEIPEGMLFKGVDVKTNTPIFEPKPKTELEILREELALTKEMATVAVEAIASMNEEVI